MSITLWDTSGSDVVAALTAQRRASGALASGLALTLVVITDEHSVSEAEQAATEAASAHPCRLVVLVRRKIDVDDRLDAEVAIGGRLGPTEAIVLRMYGRLTLHAESVVLPLLAPDTPVVTWWHGPPPERIAWDPLGVLGTRRVTDCARDKEPMAALYARATDYAPGDTDLAWTRTTGWRSLLAAAFDAGLPAADSALIRAEAGNPSAALLAGWLRARLGITVRVDDSPGPGLTEVTVTLSAGGVVSLTRPDGRSAVLSRTGQPDRRLPLARRTYGDLMAEELRRLDADQPYADALAAATGTDENLSARQPARVHEWRDPEEQAAAEPVVG